MRTLSSALALALVAGLAVAPPVLASEDNEEFAITLSAPGPRMILDDALASLRAHDLAGAMQRIEQAQNRLINDSHANGLPAQNDVTAMRDAVVLLDAARQAVVNGDSGGAEQAVGHARALL